MNFSKSRKGIGNASCNLCGNACQTTMHAIRDCVKAMHIWKSLVPKSIVRDFFSLDLQSWIKLNLNYKGVEDSNWKDV